jgi:ankyrin repeat protein
VRKDFFAPDNIITILFEEFIEKKIYMQVDANNETIFHKIAKNNTSPRSDAYLDTLVALNPPVRLVSIQSNSGKTALDIALESHYDYAIKKLTPITTVSLIDSVMKVDILSVKEALSNSGTFISKRDKYGKTCLHYASEIASSSKGMQRLKALEIVTLLLAKYPALADIKDNEGKGPGNPLIATDPDVRKIIKSAKSTLLKRNPNTEKNKRGAGRKSLRRRR